MGRRNILQFLHRYIQEILNENGENSKKDLKFYIRNVEYRYFSGGHKGWFRIMECLEMNAAIIIAGIPLISTQSHAVRGSGNGLLH